MFKYLIFLFIFSIILVSCDGRDRPFKTNAEVLENHQLLDSFSEKVEYIPKNYTEIVTDTILSNGFKIKMKSSVDMENSIIQRFTVGKIKHKLNYRRIINTVEVYYQKKLIFDEDLSNYFLNKVNSKYVISESYLNNIPYLDDTSSIMDTNLQLILSRCIPQSINCREYRLTIDNNGNYKLKEID